MTKDLCVRTDGEPSISRTNATAKTVAHAMPIIERATTIDEGITTRL